MSHAAAPAWYRRRTAFLVSTVIIGIAVVAGIIVAYSRWPNDWTLQVMREWQELLVGLIAILAAGLAATFALDQMHQAERQEQARLRRLARAQRAVMPLIMSNICEYAEDSTGKLVGAWMFVAAGSAEEIGQIAPPIIAIEDLNAVKAMVEAADDEEASPYEDLLSELQIHNARWRGFTRDVLQGDEPNGLWVEQLVVDAVELYARAANLIGATRRTPHAEDLTPTTRRGTLRQLVPQVNIPGAIAKCEAFDRSNPLPAPRVFGSLPVPRRSTVGDRIKVLLGLRRTNDAP